MKGAVLSYLVRDAKIIWRVEKKRENEVLQALESGEEPSDHGTVILVVAGTMHQLNYVGGSIWQLCDGSRDIKAIIAHLSAEFEVTIDELASDVQDFIDDLIERGWLSYE